MTLFSNEWLPPKYLCAPDLPKSPECKITHKNAERRPALRVTVAEIMTKFILGIMLLSVGSAQAQRTRAISAPAAEMELCSASLTLGMTKAVFMDKVTSVCDVIKTEDDLWLLKMKGPDGKPAGAVKFAEGVISEVERSWVPNSGSYDAVDFARALISAVESGLQKRISAEGGVYCDIVRQPDTTDYTLILQLPNHRQIRVELMDDSTKSSDKRVRLLDIMEVMR